MGDDNRPIKENVSEQHRHIELLSDDDDDDDDSASDASSSFVDSTLPVPGSVLPSWATEIESPLLIAPHIQIADPQGTFVTSLFNLLDADGNGQISLADLLYKLRSDLAVRDLLQLHDDSRGIGDTQRRYLEHEFAAIHIDGSGGVTLDDFSRFIYSRYGLHNPKADLFAELSNVARQGAATRIQAIHRGRRARTRYDVQRGQHGHDGQQISRAQLVRSRSNIVSPSRPRSQWRPQLQQAQQPRLLQPQAQALAQAQPQQPQQAPPPQQASPPPPSPQQQLEVELPMSQFNASPQPSPTNVEVTDGPTEEQVMAARDHILRLARRPNYEFCLDRSDAVDDGELIHDSRRPPTSGLDGIKAGSLRKLVELLTSNRETERPDTYGAEVLLRTHHFSPGKVLDMLMRRYLIPAVTARADSTDWTRCDAARSATLWLLQQWIQIALAEIPYTVLLTLWVFIEDHVSEQDPLAATNLRADLTEMQVYEFAIAAEVADVLRPKNPGKKPVCMVLLPPDVDPAQRLAALKQKPDPPVLPPSYRDEPASSPDGDTDVDMFDLLDCKELARQITAVDHALFREVARTDFLSVDTGEWGQTVGTGVDGGSSKAADDGGDQERGALRRLLGERATRFQNWVSSCVVRAEEPAVALRKWINVAGHCMALNNLNGTVWVVHGLEHVATRTAWNQLQKIAADSSDEGAAEAFKAQADIDMFMDLLSKCSPDDNYGCICKLARRSTLLSHSPVCLFFPCTSPRLPQAAWSAHIVLRIVSVEYGDPSRNRRHTPACY